MSYIKELLNNRTPKKIKLINLERYNIIASFDFHNILDKHGKRISDIQRKSRKHIALVEIIYDYEKKQPYLCYLNKYGVRYNRINFIEAVLIIASLLFNTKEYDSWDDRLVSETIAEATHIFAEKLNINVNEQELLENVNDYINSYKIKDFRNIKYKKKVNLTRNKIGIETENNVALNYLYFKDNSKPMIIDIISIIKIISQDYIANQICNSERTALSFVLGNISFLHKPFLEKVETIVNYQ
jgi:hypothetical protein